MKTATNCKVCGVEMSVFPSRIKDGKGRHCSSRCAAQAKHTGAELSCARCGKRFYRRGAETPKGERGFCTRACYDASRELERDKSTYKRSVRQTLHRRVAAATLGRDLLTSEVVHHIDGDITNNAPENLAVLPSQAAHRHVHNGRLAVDPYRLTALARQEEPVK